MANHYFQLTCPNRVNVFKVPFRCTTAQATRILMKAKNPDFPLADIFEPEIVLPPMNEEDAITDRPDIRLEQIEAYHAVAAIKLFKLNNAPAPKKFIVDEITIKKAYKDCGAKLKNFRDAQTLIGLVMDSAEKANDFKELQQLVMIETTAVNAGVSR